MVKTDKIPMSPVDQERKLTTAKFMLFQLGFSQKRTAMEMGICSHTLCRWVKRHGWREKLKAIKEQRSKNTLKWDDSLTGFVVYAKIHNKALHAVIEPLYKQYLKTL